MKTISSLLALALITATIFILTKEYGQKTVSQNAATPSPNQQDISNQNVPAVAGFQPPLNRAKDRVTKKPFGIYITPATSPIKPERFQGYHTGTDFEIFPEETNIDVPVRAICAGKLMLKEYASGYGGVAVESCTLNGNPITVIYGHLKLASLNLKANDNLNAGDTFGILGAGNSVETDGERKHLHLGIHLGLAVNIRGYVNSKAELSQWLDACQYVCFN